MSELSGESLNITEQNLARMEQLFPEAFTEGKIDFGILRQLLGDFVDDDEERYSFRWNGKGKALRTSQTPSLGTLRPCKEESKDWDTTQNLYIEGDNLEVLKLLQKSYYGRVKMIYIDPPYNTGKDFVYKDNYRDNIENYKKVTGQTDSEGHNIATNTESNGRFHTDWLNMMYPRLRLARTLLSEDGVIFISIDDNEQVNLKKMCDEIFGENNFVACFPWRKRTAKSDVPFGVSQDYEWIVCFAKSSKLKCSSEGWTRKYIETPDFPNKQWRIHDMTTQRTATERPNSDFTIVNPKNGKEYPVNPNAVWRITKDGFPKYLKEGRIIFPGDYDFLNIKTPVLRYWKDDDEKKLGDNFGRIPVTTKLPDKIGMSQDGTKELAELLSPKVFHFPKPVKLIHKLISFAAPSNSIILDFFSGSATTAHAVMQLNAEDGGNRRFIMVQIPQPTDRDKEAYKAGYATIAEIGKERIRRAGDKILAEMPQNSQSEPEHLIERERERERERENAPHSSRSLDVGFRVFKLDSSNLKRWNPMPEDLQLTLQESVDNFLPGRTELDVVYEILLKMGFDLSVPIEEHEAAGGKIYAVDRGRLMICLGNSITIATAEEIIKLHREYNSEYWEVVFQDSGFASDTDKTNIRETLKVAGLDEDCFVCL